MDELIFSGKKYISSKRAAQITGYAKDYVGQLARAGKVPGTRVGRAWYVDEEALLAHVNSEHTADSPENAVVEPIRETAAYNPSSSVKTIPTYALYQPKNVTKTWETVKYLVDDDDLLPMLTKRPSIQTDEISSKNIVISSITSAQNNSSRPYAAAQRVQVLMDGILPPQPVLRVAKPARHVSEVKRMPNKKKASYMAAVTVVFAVLCLAVALSGLFVSSSIEFSSSSSDYTAGVFAGFQHFLDAFGQSDFYLGGIESLREFINAISSSFFSYLESGIDFLRNL